MYRLGALLLLLALSCAATAQAPPSMLKLTCEGTATDSLDPGSKDGLALMGIIVDFTDNTVQGFGYPNGSFNHPVMITTADDVTVKFYGEQEGVLSSRESIIGSIDRVTGDVEATLSLVDQKTNKARRQITYALQCRPTQRLEN
jgi:hypothetical protein